MNSTTSTITRTNDLTAQLQLIVLRALPADLDNFLLATEDRWFPYTPLEQMAHAEREELCRRQLERRFWARGSIAMLPRSTITSSARPG